MRLIYLAIFAFLLACQPALAADADIGNATTLDINAQVDVKAEPDIATVSAGVMTSAATADAAMKENGTRMNAVFKALKDAGIADKDIQTSGININAQYEYKQNETPRVTGYQASNNVSVIIRDLKNIGPVLDALVAQGANQMNGPTFTLENPDAVLDQARKDAVAKARKRAELYAAATGLKIIKIRNISESANNGNPVPYPMMAMRAKMADATAESTPVASGQVSLGVTVNVTYELGQSN